MIGGFSPAATDRKDFLNVRGETGASVASLSTFWKSTPEGCCRLSVGCGLRVVAVGYGGVVLGGGGKGGGPEDDQPPNRSEPPELHEMEIPAGPSNPVKFY
ncbi:Uncharacterized protein TCM_016764 [Theobroma cacao]|uniref:Uncharacterized protein n=1 Tax=Theobroma cacao TaxID=3641 RepID=A0A061EB85_THECC|nr:Uncharacterized protein TCM_016764 [Theobroma cacao]